jgi:hypothetical protein
MIPLLIVGSSLHLRYKLTYYEQERLANRFAEDRKYRADFPLHNQLFL